MGKTKYIENCIYCQLKCIKMYHVKAGVSCKDRAFNNGQHVQNFVMVLHKEH